MTKVKIGDLITRYKELIKVEDGVAYKQVTIRTKHKGVVLRGIQQGAAIGTKNQYVTRQGQFILSRIDARNGAFGIVPEELEGAIITNDFWSFDINEKRVLRDFFCTLIQAPAFDDACNKASIGTTNRQRINEEFFLNYELDIPPLEEQIAAVQQINAANETFAAITAELTHQAGLLAQLRQAVLREAVRGQLVAQNPADEPAAALLARIRAEKQRLIAAKQLRQEKPLPPLPEADAPYALPQGWEWVRLRELTIKIGAGSTPTGGKQAYPDGGIKFIRSQNVYDDGLRLDGVAFIFEETHKKMKGTHVRSADLLLNITGASIGRCSLVPSSFDTANVNQHVCIIRAIQGVLTNYIHLVATTSFFKDLIMEVQVGVSREGLSIAKLEQFPIPLPPLAEQHRIVAKVTALLSQCDALEAGLSQARQAAAALHAAALREAFEPAAAQVAVAG